MTPEEAARVEALIREDPELAEAETFYRWLDEQLPGAFADVEEPGDSLRQKLEQLTATPAPDAVPAKPGRKARS